MNEIKIFLLTKIIIQESEKSLLESFKTIPLLKSYDENHRLPSGYMLFGLKEFFKPFGELIKILLYTIIAITLYHIAIGIDLEAVIFSIFVLVSTIAFAVPSTYAFYGVEEKHVKKVLNILFLSVY